MIAVTVSRTKDGIQVAGSMGANDNDELIDELACLCADAIDMMAASYPGEDDVGELMERSLAEAIANRRVQNGKQRMERQAQDEQEKAEQRMAHEMWDWEDEQGDALH